MSAQGTLMSLTVLVVIHLIDIAVGAGRFETMKTEHIHIFQPGDVHLRLWFDTAAGPYSVPSTNEEAEGKLRIESCNETSHASLYRGTLSMCNAYVASERITSNCPAGLLVAECKAVYMYSTAFYDTYNTNIRSERREYYKVFTALLYKAVFGLASLAPPPRNEVLYRGLRGDFRLVTSPFHFTHFVSTSLDLEVAEQFGNDTIIAFETNNLRLGAMLQGLVEYEIEREVLLTPFETFEVIAQYKQETRTMIYVRSSYYQTLVFVPSSHDDEL